MAKKPTTRTLDSDVAKELERALDLDLSVEGDGDGGLDMAASMEDLEAQISAAADELAREGRSQKEEPAVVQNQNAKPAQNTQPAAKPKPAELRPVETRNGAQPAGFTPANDDRQKDYRTLLHGLNRRASSTIYWVVAFISLAWIAGAGGLANLLFGPGIWKIRTVDQFFARPELI
ncbi:MAG: hypothetical protein E5W59_10830, partial [Mesorhizobium sp.]